MERIATCMEVACASKHIGYDQGQRNALYNAAKKVSSETTAALETALGSDTQASARVKIVGGKCYVRTGPTTDFAKLGVAKEGTVWPYSGQQSVDGCLMIQHNAGTGWVSGEYARFT